MVNVSLIIPSYNEDHIIRDTILCSIKALNDFCGSYELIISDNGSTDETVSIVEKLCCEYDMLKLVHEPEQGRGLAVATGFRHAEGDVLAFIDADLSTNMVHLEELIESVQTGPYDVATGSRWMPGHETDRPLSRTIASRGFNLLARILLGSLLRDHQCGFKSFSQTVVSDVMDDIESAHWFWDTEFLVLAKAEGYSIKEFSVDWETKADSTVNLTQDIPIMGVKLLYLAIRLKN